MINYIDINLLSLDMMDEVRKNFKIIRESKGLTQEKMCELMNKTQSSYARLETGATIIDLNDLSAFAAAFDMSPLDVITYPKKYVDKDSINSSNEIDAIVQIRLRSDKKEEVLKLLFGNQLLEVL